MAPKKRTPAKIWILQNPYFKGDAVKYDLPYFAHEVLDPGIYPFDVGKPVLGAFQLKMDGALNKVHDYDFDDSSDDGLSVAKAPATDTASKGKNLALAITDKDSAKRLKISGGHAATAKKVTWDMDSDDEIIVSMKTSGRTEKEIADRLTREGRIRYHSKTIGTRWARLKKAIQQHQDDLMDGELTDWHDGDDDALHRAIAKADAELEIQKQKLEDKKWKMVSDNLKAIKPVTNFSQRACRERADALESNTAKPTPESIADKTEEVLKRIQSRKDKEMKLLVGGTTSGMFTGVGGHDGPHAHDNNHSLLPVTPENRKENPKKRARTVKSDAGPSRRVKTREEIPGRSIKMVVRTTPAAIANMDGAADEVDTVMKEVADGEEHYDSETFANEVESMASSEHSDFDPKKA